MLGIAGIKSRKRAASEERISAPPVSRHGQTTHCEEDTFNERHGKAAL